MTARRRICVVTGGRADYGLLQWVMHDIRAAGDLELQLIATGSHLEASFGMTADQIEADGFHIDARVPLGLESDGPLDTVRAMARCLTGVSEALETLQPDIMLVLGDRYEIFAAAQAALIHRVPIAHIAGGDTTEGAFDESIRHALTQMAHIHLTTHETSARRVRQMGAAPDRVHVVGSPGLDQLRRRPLLDRAALEAALGAPLGPRNILVTFHPVTLTADRGQGEFEALLAALDALPADVVKWVTRPNADPGHRAIETALDVWAGDRPDVRVFASLGQLRYLSLMAQVDAVVGNSSSGLYEAPSFGAPTVDIGDRQKGRLAAASVIRCPAEAPAIAAAVLEAFALDCTDVVNLYGDGFSAGRIVRILRDAPPRETLLAKAFHEVGQ
ncbi:MAG: UDP-N-acetylglucosamine 2-epimerase [Brevundimonas sp.]|uniref:UDP-N-acetylglucosamine 2-epimerase n=1 Tax=Brevundimonas sp. TaxID=1871086 RepID=UPI0024880502|nr:UDP-N-acetylglucosamine 2-epimerase [Brevundimonas sp.]MDI1325532.1 UDP-N-acetylglucosamine 2-epimerase [Brevundimonas sp.]